MFTKIIVFDLGNVIFKFDLMKFIKAYIQRIPDHKITDFNELIPTYSEFAYSYEKGNISSFDFYDILAKRTQYLGTYNEFVFQWNNIFEPMPETIELIAMLASKYKLAILSNTNELHFDYLKDRYPEAFALFNDFFLSYKMHLRKPEDEIYQQVIRRYNVLPSEIFFIDDMEENIKAAKRNGINAWLFTKTYDLTKKLKEEKVLI
ncbi:MAG: HAD family phosphatase [Endomicrobium sp.]|jgi:putative hydrolase of the HAD superfamily|nr:HAD family phosphatase [Endomicrobium sp.]MDR2818773.1 HAD family phosphatase [Endomicrobium sp.]